MRRTTHAVTLVAALAAASVAQSQDAPKPKPVTTSDAEVSAADLELLAKPLTKAELTVEADAWLGLLREKVSEISAAEVAAGRATAAEEKTRLLEVAAKARDERTRRIDRLNVILAALRAKGGKSDEYDAYVNAVSGISMKITDAAATWTAVMNWLKSGEGGLRYGKNAVLFVFTLMVFQVLASVLARIMSRAMTAFKNVSKLLADFVINTTRKCVLFVGFVVALSMLEVNIGPFLAAMGAAGFVIGFALQGTLSNFAAGVMILLYRPYDLNDHVIIAGVNGRVVAMTLVSTIVENADKHVVTIPNSSIWGGTITRLTSAAA
ncbi:MAG: hypothetical protein CHACPFDD_01232 [Phycisphaerae bacterium]|nr:hypothetical protein [Phycisphaerae bacterium]